MNQNAIVFVTNSYEFSNNCILEYMGRLIDPIFDYNKIVKKTTKEDLPQYLEYLEINYSISIEYFYVFTPNSIFEVQNNKELKYIIRQNTTTRSDPLVKISKIYLNLLTKSEIIKYDKLKRLLPSNFSENLLLEQIVIFKKNFENNEIRSFLKQINQIFGNKFPDQEIFLTHRQSTNPIIKFLSFQVLEVYYNMNYDLPTRFQVFTDILSSLNTYDIKFIGEISRIISLVMETEFRNIIQYINVILFQFFVKSRENSIIDIKMINELIIHSLSIQFSRYYLTQDLFKLLNIYSGILLYLVDDRTGNIFLTFLNLKLLRKEFTNTIHYNESITTMLEQLEILLNNLSVSQKKLSPEFLEVSKNVKYNISVRHITNELINLIQTKQDYFTDWMKFLLYDINHIERMYKFTNYINSDEFIPKSMTQDEFLDEVVLEFNLDLKNPIELMYLIRLLFFIVQERLMTTEKDPNDLIRTRSIFDLIHSLYEDLSEIDHKNNLIDRFQLSHLDLSLIESDARYRDILFGDFTTEDKLKNLIYFFSTNDQVQGKNYLFPKRLRTLKYIISNLDKSFSTLIHQILDLLEIHSHSVFDVSYLLIQLIRAYLEDRPIDSKTLYYLGKYLDTSQNEDFSDLNKEKIKKFIENISENSKNSISIDLGELKVEMEQNLELIDNEPDHPEVLPLDSFSFFEDEEPFKDYFIFHNTYNRTNKKLDEDNKQDLTELFYFILNHNPYADRLKPYAKELTELRHTHDNVVDHIQFEILKIKILAKLKPEEALSRLQGFMERIKVENLNPTLDNYFEIVGLFKLLATKVGKYNIIYPYDLLFEKLLIFEEYFNNFLLKDFMFVIQQLDSDSYTIFSNQGVLIEMIEFILTNEFENNERGVKNTHQRKKKPNENSLTDWLNNQLVYWNDFEKIKLLMQDWLKFSEEIIEIVDKLATKFSSIKGLTDAQLHLLENDILTIDELYDILVRKKEPYYRLRTIFLSIRYLIKKGYFEQVEVAFDELYDLLKKYDEIFFYHHQMLALVKIGREVDYTNWIEILEVIYYQNAPENLIQEFNKVLKQDIEKYDKTRVHKVEEVYQPIIDYFTRDNFETAQFMNKFLADKEDKNPEKI